MEVTKDNQDSVEDDGSKGGAELNLDSILVEEIGQFGWYQRRAVALCAVVSFLGGFSVNDYVFTAARIPTRCVIPECDNGTAKFTPPWLSVAIPSDGDSFDNCQRFNSSNILQPSNDTCSAKLFDRDKVVPCEEYVYQNTETIVYEFGLACEEWRRSVIGTASTLGMMCALPLTGLVADLRGRRTALALNAFNRAWLGVARYWTQSYASYITLEFLEGVFGAAAFTCAYTIAMEFVGPKYRVVAGVTISTFFAVGEASQALVAWLVPNWRHLTLALFAPQLIVVIYFWIMPESVRWYMSKGRYKESEKTLKHAAKINGNVLSEKSLQALKQNSEEERKKNELKREQDEEPWLVVLVFRHKPILLRCVVTPVWWITTILVYYGLSMNAVHIAGNKYINYMAVSLVEIPGYWTAVLLLDRTGRKPLLSGGFFICTACQIAFIFMPEGHSGFSLAVYLLGKYCISMVITSIYIYTNELYPTQFRTRLFAFSSMISRIGSAVAPLTPALGSMIWEPLPFVLFGGLGAVSGLLVLVTPETKGTTLPDSMEQAADLGRTTKI